MTWCGTYFRSRLLGALWRKFDWIPATSEGHPYKNLLVSCGSPNQSQDASSLSWLKPPHHHRFIGPLSEKHSGALKSLTRSPFSTVDTCQNLGASGLKNLSVYAKSSVGKAPGKWILSESIGFKPIAVSSFLCETPYYGSFVATLLALTLTFGPNHCSIEFIVWLTRKQSSVWSLNNSLSWTDDRVNDLINFLTSDWSVGELVGMLTHRCSDDFEALMEFHSC